MTALAKAGPNSTKHAREESPAAMSVLLILLLVALGFGLILALISLSLLRFKRQAGEQLTIKFQEANKIVNQQQVPEAWLAPFRQQLEKARRSGSPEKTVERVGERAKKHVLKELKSLIQFLENGQFYDSLETRTMLVDALKAQQQAWADHNWQALFETATPSSAPHDNPPDEDPSP